MPTKRKVYWELCGRLNSMLDYLDTQTDHIASYNLDQIYDTLRKVRDKAESGYAFEKGKEEETQKEFDEYGFYGENNPPLKPTEEY